MSKLENFVSQEISKEYCLGEINSINYESNRIQLFRQRAYKKGFDACLQLDLAVLFSEWKDEVYDLVDIPNQSIKAYKDCVNLREKIWNIYGDIPDNKELYKYWLENIFKID